jgi:hypothetical protein
MDPILMQIGCLIHRECRHCGGFHVDAGPKKKKEANFLFRNGVGVSNK